MDLDQLDLLLDPTPLPLEMGYERLANGTLHIAMRTDMRGCTGAMLEWWFRFRPNTRQYKWWHPVDHVSSEWGGSTATDTHVGSEHIVVESFAGSPPRAITIQFRDPTEFFDPEAYDAARADGRVSAAVVARGGDSHDPLRLPDGRLIGNRMVHIGRDTEWGMVLRSHFFLGVDLATQKAPAEVAAQVPEFIAHGLIQHGYNEYTFLSRFLPSIYVAENPDVTPPMPW